MKKVYKILVLWLLRYYLCLKLKYNISQNHLKVMEDNTYLAYYRKGDLLKTIENVIRDTVYTVTPERRNLDIICGESVIKEIRQYIQESLKYCAETPPNISEGIIKINSYFSTLRFHHAPHFNFTDNESYTCVIFLGTMIVGKVKLVE